MQAKNLQLGTLTSGERVTVDVRLEEKTGRGWRTTDHRAIDRYFSFGIMGAIYDQPRGWYDGGCHSAGQILDTLRAATWNKIAEGVELSSIFTLWDRWHLNDLHAACVHQTTIPGGLSGDAWKTRQGLETAKCPCGYVYGSAWLVEPIPQSELERIVGTFFPRDLSQSGPGKNGNGDFIA